MARSLTSMTVMVVFGVLGYLMRKLGYEPAPLILSQGDFTVFLVRPISAACLALAAVALLAPLLTALARRRSRFATEQT